MANYTAKIGSQYQLVLIVNTTSQNQANNTSTLSYSLRVDKLSGYGYWANSQSYSIRINGQTIKSGTWSYDFNNYSSKTIDSGSITLSHNSNGELSVSVGASVTMYLLGTGTISQTYTAAKIPRGIESFIFNIGWGRVDETKNVTFSKPVSSIRAQLEWKYYNEKNGGWSNTRTVSTNYTSGSSFSFSTSDIDLLHSQNPNSKTVYVEVTLKSYQNDTLTKTVTRGVNLNLKTEPPIINSTFEVRGQNQSLLGSSNRAVQSIHKLKINDNVTVKNGASLSRVSVEFEGRTINKSNAEFDITKAGSSDVYYTAVDSRGFTYRKKIGTVIVTKYLPPSLTSYKAIRLDNGVQNPLGETAAVIGNIRISNVLNSSGSNVNSAWWKVDFQGTTYQNSTINATKSLPIEESQNFTLEFGDKFKSLKISGYIPVGAAPLVLGKKGIGINTVPPENEAGVHIGGDLNADRSVNFYNGKIKQVFKTATGYNLGNGLGFEMDFGTETNLLFLSDGSIWITNRSGKAIKKIAG